MSRRKQAKPRSLRRDDNEDWTEEKATEDQDLPREEVSAATSSASPPPHCAPSDESLDSDALGTEGGSSWSSEGQSSPPSSCATPNSATELADSELAFTVGVTNATPYPCQFCDKAFPRLSYLKKHEQTHSEHLPFICEFCKRRFKHKRSKDRHLKLHTGDKRYKCSQCQAAFARSDHLKIHMKTHDNQKPFQCTVCNRGYNTAAALTSHMQNHKKPEAETSTPGSMFKCLECSEMFTKPEQLTSHMLNNHGGSTSKKQSSQPKQKFACVYCTKDKFSSAEALELHVQAMHGSNLNGGPHYDYRNLLVNNGIAGHGISCRLCTMVFPSLSLLQAHAAAAHEGSDADLHCVHCGISLPSLHAFAEHLLFVHPNLKPPEHPLSPNIKVSDQLTPTDLSVVRKDMESTPPPSKRMRSCVATTPDVIQTSQGVQYDHPGVLLCNQCNAALPDFESFRSHLKSHLDESAFVPVGGVRQPKTGICPYCGAHFVVSEDLLRHLGTHFLSTVTEYGCQKCYKLFSKSEDLQKHLIEHHSVHLYKCTLCKEVFESKVAIQVHFAVKHCSETKQYRCTACPNFPPLHSELEFRFHIRAVHSVFNMSPPNPPLASSPRMLRCVFCNMTCSTELEMQFHLSMHTKRFQCPHCSDAFHVEYLLEKHIQMNHPNQENLLRHNLADGQDKVRPKETAQLNGFHVTSSAPPAIAQGNNSNSSCLSESGKRHEFNSQVNNNNNENTIGTCDICECSDFSSEAELNAHRKLVHHLKSTCVPKLSLHCAYCKESCKSRSELENHMKSHCHAAMGGTKHKCNICDEIFISAAILAEHKLTHCKVVYGSICTHCKAPINTEEDFIGHVVQHNNTAPGNGQHQLVLPVACVICRQTLSSEIETRLHAKFHLKMEVIKCSQCLKNVERDDINGGLCSRCHRRSVTPLKCPHCLLKFEFRSSLDFHIESLHKKLEFQCSKCQMGFETEDECEAHMSKHSSAEARLKCNLCMFVLSSPQQLQAHLIEHTFAGCPNYTCYLCSSVFTTAIGLQSHIQEHGASVKPYDCSICSSRFYFRAELDNHCFIHVESYTRTSPKKESEYAPMNRTEEQRHNSGANSPVANGNGKPEETPNDVRKQTEPIHIKEEKE